MRVALGQMDLAWQDKEENKKRCAGRIQEAAESEADIILFPEMTLTGFTMDVVLAADRQGETIAFFSALAGKYDIAVGFGYVTEREGRGRNHFCILDKRGEVLEDYVKIHPFTYGGEADYFEGGSRICHFTWNGFHCGMFICYDLRFPDCFQKLPLDTDVVFLIANWPESRIDHWYALLKARAIEMQCYMVGVNRVGTGGGLTYPKSSVVYDAEGKEVPQELLMTGTRRNLYVELDRESRLDYVGKFPTRRDGADLFFS